MLSEQSIYSYFTRVLFCLSPTPLVLSLPLFRFVSTLRPGRRRSKVSYLPGCNFVPVTGNSEGISQEAMTGGVSLTFGGP